MQERIQDDSEASSNPCSHRDTCHHRRISTGRAVGQQAEQHYSPKELRTLVATARVGDDYQKLSEYFHREKQEYRAKAEAEMRVYARCYSFYRPKYPTGADYAARTYKLYSAGADHAEKPAAFYDDLSVGNGLKPASGWLTVSYKHLLTKNVPAPAELADIKSK